MSIADIRATWLRRVAMIATAPVLYAVIVLLGILEAACRSIASDIEWCARNWRKTWRARR